MKKTITGYVRIFGDNIDTDQIYPGRYLELTDPADIGKHAMEGADPDYAATMKEPGIIVAGDNFGCGSSREHAVITLLNAGVKGVVASSFGRIFFRNAINLGLPAVVSPGIREQLSDDDCVELDLEQGEVRVAGTDRIYPAQKMPEYVRDILAKGGLIAGLREEMTK